MDLIRSLYSLSLFFSLLGSEKLVPAVAEFASDLTLQETDVSSLVETDVSSLVEMFSTTSLEESIVGPGTVPHNTIGSSLRSSPFTCQKFMAAPAESSSPKRDVSSSEELLDATLPEETIIAIPGILPHKALFKGLFRLGTKIFWVSHRMCRKDVGRGF